MRTGLSLSEFRTRVSDLARPNRFEVEINPPSPMSSANGFENFHWLVQSAVIPARTQGSVGMKYHGMEFKLTGDYSHEDLTITFLNSYDWGARNFFELWAESRLQAVSGNNARRDSMSSTDETFIIVHQVGRVAGDIIASYKFHDIFPTNISEIELNMGSNDAVETYTVTFAYSYWENINVSI